MTTFVARLLGAPSLTDASGACVESLLAQPKRFAVLAYLAVEGRTAPVSRDKVAALFWPELDQSRARQALRQSVHVLRKELGDDAVAGVGAELLALGPAVSTDIATFADAMSASRFDDAIALYRGPFLDGFHVSDAPEFEQWLSATQAHFRDELLGALRALAESAERAGELDAAVRWTRRQLALADMDERPLRRLMAMLRRQGNAAAAVSAYDDFAAWLHREMEMEPSDESAALAAEIRAEAASSGEPASRPGMPFTLAAHPPVLAPPATAPAGVAAPPARTSHLLPRLAFAATIVIAVVAAVVAGRRMGSGEATPLAPSVAVLPFLDLSAKGDEQYLTDGLTEELITALSKVRGLRVPARTSSFAYRDARADVPRIARDLKVTSVLEGSVRRDGDRLRITAQLIDAKTGYHIWSDNFDRRMSDVFGVQDEIAGAIARALRVELVGPSATTAAITRPGRGPAYEAYLRGRYYWNQRGADGVGKAIQLFQQAADTDSTYAPALAGLASALQFAPTFELMTPAEAFPRAQAAVRRALLLDSTLAEARAVNGYVKMVWERDLPGAERELRRAAELAPGYATPHQWLRLYLVTMGRYDEAVDEALRARELDPVSPSILAALGDAYVYAKRYDAAKLAFNAALELDGDFDRALNGLAEIAVETGDARAGVALMERCVSHSRGNTRNAAQLAYAAGRAGARPRVDSILAAMRVTARTQFVPPYAFAVAHAGAGNADSTIAWLTRAVDDHDNWVGLLAAGPEFALVSRDARTLALVARVRGARPAAH
ncbi:MAG TPA: BTAD domain-containing putative transcriptional regulator [Gemmatimonadaceae bacterium]|nr:BTAD domain-containing putative transcriptional regulator [Gemmatimonadaceae bacterium]